MSAKEEEEEAAVLALGCSTGRASTAVLRRFDALGKTLAIAA